MNFAALARVLRVAASECDRISEEQRQDRAAWIDQTKTLLGARRHCRIVRSRVERGEPGAAIVRRRFLLSHEAHDAELAKLSRAGAPKSEPSTFGERLRAELRMVGGGRT